MAANTITINNCPLCESFASPSMKGVVRHIGLVHAHEPGFRITCGVRECSRAYTNFSSYKKHMFVKHRDVMVVSNSDCGPSVSDDDSILLHSEEEMEEEQPYIAHRDRSAALFILKASEIHKVSQSALNGLLGDISEFIDMTKERLMHKVGAALTEKGITMDGELLAISNSSDVKDPFSNLSSEYLQTQYFTRNFNLVVSSKNFQFKVFRADACKCAVVCRVFLIIASFIFV